MPFIEEPETLPSTLLVFAHLDEAVAFADVPHLVTGVGKVNAVTSLAYELAARTIAGNPVQRVLVLGTAGLVTDDFGIDEVVHVTSAVQHDFSLPSPILEFGESLDGVLSDDSNIRTGCIATGDQFVSDNVKRRQIADLGAGLCDMEIYAYATVCARFEVDLQVFKIPSDFADDSASQELWDDVVPAKSAQLREFYDRELSAL